MSRYIYINRCVIASFVRYYVPEVKASFMKMSDMEAVALCVYMQYRRRAPQQREGRHFPDNVT